MYRSGYRYRVRTENHHHADGFGLVNVAIVRDRVRSARLGKEGRRRRERKGERVGLMNSERPVLFVLFGFATVLLRLKLVFVLKGKLGSSRVREPTVPRHRDALRDPLDKMDGLQQEYDMFVEGEG